MAITVYCLTGNKQRETYQITFLRSVVENAVKVKCLTFGTVHVYIWS